MTGDEADDNGTGDEAEDELADGAIARLTIYSETGSAEDLAEVLGVTPDEAWNRGDPGRRGRPLATTAVSFHSHVPEDAPPNEHLSDLLTRIEPVRDSLRRHLAAGNDVAHLKLALFLADDNPTPALTADVLRRLADFGLDLELDIYAF